MAVWSVLKTVPWAFCLGYGVLIVVRRRWVNVALLAAGLVYDGWGGGGKAALKQVCVRRFGPPPHSGGTGETNGASRLQWLLWGLGTQVELQPIRIVHLCCS